MKKITALFTVLLMLVASSAMAAVNASFPAAFNGSLGSGHAKENGTYLHYTGFAVNASATPTDAFAVFYNNRTTNNMLVNGTSKNLNGTYHQTNGSTISSANFRNGTIAGNAAFRFDESLGSVDGLTTYGVQNSSINATTYYVPAGNYQLLVGYANASVNASRTRSYVGFKNLKSVGGRAISMPIIYANGTFNGIESSSDTWDYYAFGMHKGYPVYVFGQVQITAESGESNAKVKYYVDNGTNDTDKTGSWINYNATGLKKGSLGLSATDYRTLLENATINSDQNLITGYTDTTGADERVFAVMIKNGSTLSSSDLSNRAFRMIYSGTGDSAKYFRNGTASVQNFVYNNDLSIRDGNAELVTAGQAGNLVMNAQALDNYSTEVASTSQFGIAQSNMTTKKVDGSTESGSFIGKQSADKSFSVGIYIDTNESGTGTDYVGLGFLIPSSAVTSEIVAAGAGYQANSTLAAAGTNFTNNATGYTQKTLRDRWSGVASNFTPLTEVKGYSVTLPAGSKGDIYHTAQYKFTGVGGKISNLRLYKVSPHSTSSWKSSYSSDADTSSDGAWWISTNVAGGHLDGDSVLDVDTDYYLNWVVKDNGRYDANSTVDRGIIDPVVLGSVPTSSSSSSSGCVFNPAAGFGLEWLMLMLAPMVAIVRSRFKK